MAARLLLIEDDASIARFVELALGELPEHDDKAPAIEFTLVRSVAEARAALAAGGWRLVVSDLMLPDGSAEALLTEGFAQADGAPAWVVFSAGVNEERQARLMQHGVARVLCKPVPLAELLDTVAGLLRGAVSAAPAPALPPVADPVRQHFGGDRALYESFRAGCIERFADDLAQGDAATAGADAASLRRVAHGLKAVLELIGQPVLAAQARRLEQEAADWAPGMPWPAGWVALAQGLIDLGAWRHGAH
ncbi:MAG: response regulator transcription factor [Burkholderiales bacterium]|nr:response regulator transcription factor [Burkholderiales bacterium]